MPFPYWHHFSLPPSTPTSELSKLSLNQLHLLLSQQTAPRDTAAILIEPVMGEGGYVPAPPEFLQGLREICDKEGILLIIDEVQSGFGRTGKNFAVEYSGVRPDIMTIAKVYHPEDHSHSRINPYVHVGLGQRIPTFWCDQQEGIHG